LTYYIVRRGITGDANGAATKKTSSTSALQKAVNALTQKESSRRRKRDEVIGDADVTIRYAALVFTTCVCVCVTMLTIVFVEHAQ
jgi:hypothetical protein